MRKHTGEHPRFLEKIQRLIESQTSTGWELWTCVPSSRSRGSPKKNASKSQRTLAQGLEKRFLTFPFPPVDLFQLSVPVFLYGAASTQDYRYLPGCFRGNVFEKTKHCVKG